MNPILLIGALLGGVLGVFPVVAEGTRDSTWSDHLRAARAALARKDLASARRDLGIVDSIVGGHPGSMAALASIAARQGQRGEALEWLRALAATGLVHHLESDTSFARWRDDPEFREVAARLDSNGARIATSTVATRLGDAALLTEDVTWDPGHRRFLLSSIHRRGIIAIDVASHVTDFLRPGAEGTWGIYALGCDARRGRLWATTAAGPECEDYASVDSGRTALLAYDLRSARLLERSELPRDGARHVLGDLTVAEDGTVYVSESLGGAVYRHRPGSAGLDTLVPPGTFGSPQTPALAADGRRLFVADYPRGVASIDLSTREVRWLAKPHSLAEGGIDGLYRDGDRLIAIQNGTKPHRVIVMELDRDAMRIVSWRVIEQASEWLGEPNHGVIVGRSFYFIGNSGWERVNNRGQLETSSTARPPVLLRLPLGADP